MGHCVKTYKYLTPSPSYSSGEAGGQCHLQVSFESDQCRHQDEHLCYHLEHLPVLEHTNWKIIISLTVAKQCTKTHNISEFNKLQ